MNSKKSQRNLKPLEFSSRRTSFLKQIKGALAVFPSATPSIRNSDVDHPFRQDSNFFYLTGFEEPHSICLLAPQCESPFQLFVQAKDPVKELWDGPICGPKQARQKYGADAAFTSEPSEIFDEIFIEQIQKANALYYRVGMNEDFDRRIFGLMKKALRKLGRTGRSLWPIKDPNELISEMRLIKSQAEIERMQTAAEITAEGHSKAMQYASAGMHEYELDSNLSQYFRKNGASRLGYQSIVATGSNACVLHYIENKSKLKSQDLLLIDAGAEYDYYSADITRTFPVSGKFSTEQKEIYNAVLDAQKSAIKMAVPGNTIKQLQETAIKVLVKHLLKLKILKGDAKKLIKDEAFKPYYPHGIGHWLGLDVHDAGRYYQDNYDQHRKLKAGMVLTVEPGLYFGKNSKCPPKYKGIGVRIEDDILITKTGNKILTKDVPKEVNEVESLCQQSM